MSDPDQFLQDMLSKKRGVQPPTPPPVHTINYKVLTAVALFATGLFSILYVAGYGFWMGILAILSMILVTINAIQIKW